MSHFYLISDVCTSICPLLQAQSCRSQHLNGVHWYATSFDLLLNSDPLCLDKEKFLVTRDCTEKGWVPELPPECPYKQNVRSVYDNFATFSGYDLFVIGEDAAVYRGKKKQWSNECIKFGFTDDITKYDKYFTMHPDYFWLPIRRPKAHFPHVWTNLGEKFGLVTEDFMNHGDEDCLVKNFSSDHVKSTPCDEYYSDLCLYGYVTPLLPLSCPKGWYTTRFQKDGDTQCYQVADHECSTYFRYNDPYDRILFQTLMTEFKTDAYCRIEIDPFPQNMSFNLQFWQDNIDNVSYVNWSPRVNRNFNPQLPTYTYADPEGEWHLGTNYACTVCEQSLRVRTPSMQLVYDAEEDRLELAVSNAEFLWTENAEPQIACFTTATDALLANVNVEDEIYRAEYSNGNTMVVYEVQLEDNGPGEYWCEAVTHPTFEVIKSNREVVYAVRKGVVFAIEAIHQCKPSRCLGIYDKDVLNEVSKTFKEFIESLKIDLNVEDVRVMDIINSSASRETLLFHITFSTEDIPEELEEINLDTESDPQFMLNLNLINYVNKKLQPHLFKYQWDEEFSIQGFSHIMFCVTEISEGKMFWGRMNEIKVIPRLCLTESYVLNYARCGGEFPYGVKWSTEVSLKCNSITAPPPLTQHLFELLQTRGITVEAVQKIDGSLQDTNYDLNPADVFLLGSLIGRFVNNVTDLINDPDDLLLFTKIFSHSLGITTERAAMSHRHMNATNLVLDNFERLLQRSAVELNIWKTENEKEFGVVQYKDRNSVSFIIDPSVKNITGIAYFLPESSNLFDEGRIEYVYGDQDPYELLEDENLEAAAFLPMHVLDAIRFNFTGNLRIVMTIIENNVLFQNSDSEHTAEPAGRVITASIPNYVHHLPGLFPIIFRPRRTLVDDEDVMCGYWNFHPSNSSKISEWTESGCSFLGKSTRDDDPTYMCGCQHFTNFAFLLTGTNLKGSGNNGTLNPVEERIKFSLDLITQVGCTMSLFGVILIWLTALVFRSWREREGTKVLLQLSFGIGLQVLMFLVINTEGVGHTMTSCLTVGIILHYSVLVIFAWMLITAYLQYLRYVVVFGNLLPKHFFLKANIVGWLVPILPILIICLIDPGLYIPPNAAPDFDNHLCYPQNNALYFGVILPVALVILTNLVIFVLVLYNITVGLTKCNNHRKNTNKIHRAQLRLTILLFFLLGLTWLFGLLVHLEFDTYVFTYLFVIFGTMQGFVLFFYFIILDPQTRKLWLSRFSCCYKKEVTSSTYNS